MPTCCGWIVESGQHAPSDRPVRSSALPCVQTKAAFVPVKFDPPPAPPSASPAQIRIELQHGNTAVQIHWPMQASSQLYEVERELKHLSAEERLQIRQAKSKPLADAFKEWMLLQRQKITDGSATAKALDYSLNRWGALTRFLDDGRLPIDNNWIENQIRPIAIATTGCSQAPCVRASALPR